MPAFNGEALTLFNARYMMKLRIVTGLLITLHGLLRIIFIDKYINFVHQHYYDIIPIESLLTIGSSLLPFIEFFVGLLVAFNVGYKRTLFAALLVSLFMSLFIIVGSLYPRLIYHGVICALLVSIYFIQNNPRKRKFIV